MNADASPLRNPFTSWRPPAKSDIYAQGIDFPDNNKNHSDINIQPPASSLYHEASDDRNYCCGEKSESSG